MKIGNAIVTWSHNNNGTKKSGSTQCIITSVDEPDDRVSAKAIKHEGDPYDKNKGRYISFKRAVKTIPDKTVRKFLWDGLKEKAPKIISKGSLK